ncbi:unnamed protein product [Dicrocoelium dendriticum]|nr:unnamed protein product [Dicrocoelium dendriticum]
MPVTRASTRTKDLSKSRQVTLDAVSHSGSRVSYSNSVSSTRSRLLLAELKEKQLKEELELETREQELSKQRRLLKARQEVEFAQRSALLEDEQGDVDLPALPICSSNRVDEFVTACAAVAANQPSAGCYDDLPIDPHTDTLGNAIASALVPIIAEAGLPKVELAYFDGHPADYWRFVKHFEFYVESKVVDDGRRLLYLIHYCKGRVRLTIGSYVMLPPGQGYERARCIRRDLFGQAHYITRASIEVLLQGAKSIPNNAYAMSELAIKMENCHITLKQRNYEADVDSSTTLEYIVRALPKPLPYKFLKLSTDQARCWKPGILKRRWLKEYITTLQSRQKWQLPTKSVEKDELVLVASEKLPRGCWPLGRVVSCEASNDGLVRTVYIRTNSGIVKRDVRKVCRLEGDE